MLHRPQQQLQRSDTRIVRKQAPPVPTDALETFTVADTSSNQTKPSSAESPSKSDSNSTAAFSRSNKTVPRTSSSTEFQSLKLESMSTVEEYGATSKMLSSVLEKDIVLSKQYLDSASGSLKDTNDSDSLSSSSGEERELTQSIFKKQVKFFCQMKDFLVSQQMSLRQQLETLNVKVSKKRRVSTRRQRLAASSSSIHIPVPQKPNVLPDQSDHPENVQQFFSCSSTDRSDDNFQTCPLCGLELENPENPEALEEHVAGHWCSTDPL